MPLHECPGPNRRKAATADTVSCTKCGEIEVWSDDTKATCGTCGHQLDLRSAAK